MDYEISIPKNAEMEQKAKEYMESLFTDGKWASVDELASYIYNLHTFCVDALNMLAKVLVEEE